MTFLHVRALSWIAPVASLTTALLLAITADDPAPKQSSKEFDTPPRVPLSWRKPISQHSGAGAESAPGFAGELDGAPYGLAEEKIRNRAWPKSHIPFGKAEDARQAFALLASTPTSDADPTLVWTDLGPTKARYPAVLGRTGAEYVTSGRITALAIDPNCNPERCRLFVGAAGGGVWRTDHALSNDPHGLHWQFISGELASNAVGTITIDPNDPSGNTVYVGTGEPNASVDSEAGLGIYKSTNGGDTWTRLPALALIGTTTYVNFPRDRSISALVIHPNDPLTIYVGLARGARGVGATGGAVVPPGAAPLGVYQSTDGGRTFRFMWDGNTSVRGVNAMALDPGDPSTIYAAAFQQGLWRSSPAESGGAFQRIFAPTSPLLASDRTEFALTTKDGQTRVYLGDGATGPSATGNESQVWRSDGTCGLTAGELLASQTTPRTDGRGWKKLTSSNIADPGYATFNYCTTQCWYDNRLYTPPGEPDTVYVLGSYSYNEGRRVANPRGTFSNARAVLRSTTAGEPDPRHENRTFADLTNDATSDAAPNSIHPDQHALVFAPSNHEIWFEASDGGLMRSSGRYRDVSYLCDTRLQNTPGNPPLTPDQRTTCRRLLSEVPTRYYNLNLGLSTLQFQSLSINPRRPLQSLQGGTQDNGTFVFKGSSVKWPQTNNGDGGLSGFNVANPRIRFTSNFGQYMYVTYGGGDPRGWLFISSNILFGPEGSLFYPPQIYDPHPDRANTIFEGSQGVWRTQDNGGDPDFLEANCLSIALDDPPPDCGDFEELGGDFDPQLGESPGDLTSSRRGTRPGGSVSALARAPSDTGTLWATTSVGRIFVSMNADGPAADVTYTRLDTLAFNSPPRFPSAIVVDPSNPLHAWISYSGYSALTPQGPGHVFEVDYDGRNFSMLPLDDGIGPMGDLPTTSLAMDPVTGDLYAATDFGVLRQAAGTNSWHTAGSGMPVVEVCDLQISPQVGVLYAATHGRGAYRLQLPGNRPASVGPDDVASLDDPADSE